MFQYTRHSFGATDSPTFANYAPQRTASENATQNLETAHSIQKNFYKYGYLKFGRTSKKASEEAPNLARLLRLGIFNLTKVVNNAPEIVAGLNRKIENKDVKVIASDNATSHLLGLGWKHQLDIFGSKSRKKPRIEKLDNAKNST